MTATTGWFEVDKHGLSQLVRRKGLAFILYELVQNAWDTAATQVFVTVDPIPNQASVLFTVYDDDPDGFKDLTHAYTLFAPSEKKGDVRKRGRFNLGEKLVLAACSWAKISTTTGTVMFDQKAGKLTREKLRTKRDQGSQFEAHIPMTRAEMKEVIAAAKLLLPPIPTIINGETIPKRDPFTMFETSLATEIADEEGNLKRTTRKTEVELYDALDGVSYIYEMGIPVVQVDLPWSVDINQKIPLNADRDNVTPAYLRALSVAVLNHMHDRMKPDDATNTLLQGALESPDVSPEAVNSVLTHQFGEKRVTYDPSDLEANQNAAAHGFTVIPGRTFSKPAWESIRRSSASEASSKLFPTPKPYSPDGEPVKTIPEHNWSDGMYQVARFAQRLAMEVMDLHVTVVMENEFTQPYGANYGSRTLTFNVPRLGKKWFDLEHNFTNVLDLIIHEFGHQYASSHLDAKYHAAITKLGAQITKLALRKPEVFKP